MTVYTRLRFHVRIVGRVPAAPAGVLVVGNHQLDLEGMIIPATIAAQRGFRHPVVTSASTRLFEPGFLAMRLTSPLSRSLLAGFNVAPWLSRLGVRPIEDHPLSRPLLSWAFTLYCCFGPLAVTEAFESAALQGAPINPRLTLPMLWTPAHLRWAAREITIIGIAPRYREWARRQIRSAAEREMRALARLLAARHAVFTTPEGRLSVNGRVARLRESLRVMMPAAEHVYVVSTSYDPLRPGRLRVWVHFAPVVDAGSGLKTALATARMLTASHLAAAAWRDAPNAPAALALARLDRLASAACLAPDLARHPEAVLNQAITMLAAKVRPGQPMVDSRFAHVPDLLAYLANQWDETWDALTTSQPRYPSVSRAAAPMRVRRGHRRHRGN